MKKTLVKAVTWRLIGTAELFLIAYLTTGTLATAGHTAGLGAACSLVTYVLHELAWGSR